MEPRWEKKISECLETIPPLRGGDFQGIAGLSSDDSLRVGVNSARAKFESPRAVKHRLDEPGQIIPQHGCVPALPASVSPGSGNFSRKPRSLGAAQNQASVIPHRGLEVKQQFFASGLGRNIFLTFPFIDQAISLKTTPPRKASEGAEAIPLTVEVHRLVAEFPNVAARPVALPPYRGPSLRFPSLRPL